ncbi:hypothetical protein POM88_020700 [Heracleum sosnowskyi]|uniref:Uncharacterized protein n=1 Tax=Heracleum sosnowskyi TaxID=360622 RepID=A0AAD8MNC3_9APIA|nr:hypothetical protein POM88_020700 [Heracleum sosnowskyi]
MTKAMEGSNGKVEKSPKNSTAINNQKPTTASITAVKKITSDQPPNKKEASASITGKEGNIVTNVAADNQKTTPPSITAGAVVDVQTTIGKPVNPIGRPPLIADDSKAKTKKSKENVVPIRWPSVPDIDKNKGEAKEPRKNVVALDSRPKSADYNKGKTTKTPQNVVIGIPPVVDIVEVKAEKTKYCHNVNPTGGSPADTEQIKGKA